MEIHGGLLRPKIASVKLDANFCKYPLARDINTDPDWDDSLADRWVCPMHIVHNTSIPRVELWLPYFVSGKPFSPVRCPDRFDVDVLLRLSALTEQALRQEPDDIKLVFSSSSALLEVMFSHERSKEVPSRAQQRIWNTGLFQIDPNSFEKLEWVKESLYLWKAIKIWHRGGVGEPARMFGPFIEYCEFPRTKRGEIWIQLTDEYIETLTRGTKEIPLPLPLDSEAAFNLAILIADPKEWQSDWPFYRDFRYWCDFLSVPGNKFLERKVNLVKAFDDVNKHYAKDGRRYQMVWDSIGINVYFKTQNVQV